MFHPDSHSGVGSGSYRGLVSKNYFNLEGNQTLRELGNPFGFCPTGGKGDALSNKYGATNLARTRVHAGGGARVQRVIRRAMSGLPVTIAVIGGSGM
jgi:hypothetical protein